MEGVSNNSFIDKMRWQEDEQAKFEDPSQRQRLEQEDFFQLLTQQLNMQDPTKPADNDQMIAQMTRSGPTTDCIPTDRPVIITVAGPVLPDSAILTTGVDAV